MYVCMTMAMTRTPAGRESRPGVATACGHYSQYYTLFNYINICVYCSLILLAFIIHVCILVATACAHAVLMLSRG